jgi:hypothetical protein
MADSTSAVLRWSARSATVQVDFAHFQVVFTDEPSVPQLSGCSRSCSTQPADLGAVCPAPQCAVCAVRIHGCGTSRAIDVRTIDRHPLASVDTLVLGLRCSWCPGSAPMPKLLGLYAHRVKNSLAIVAIMGIPT